MICFKLEKLSEENFVHALNDYPLGGSCEDVMQKRRKTTERTRKRRLEECGSAGITFPLLLQISDARELDLSLGFGNQLHLGCYKVKCALHITLQCAAIVSTGLFLCLCEKIEGLKKGILGELF